VVQETSLRWLRADLATVRVPEGWLVTVATRISIDRARRVVRERQAYRASWELESDTASAWTVPGNFTELAVQVSDAFHLLRSRLAPVERTAFVLREAFACEYDEIARALEKSEAACRQIVRRARERLQRPRPRLRLSVSEAPDLTARFIGALAAGDRQAALAALNDQTTDARRRVASDVRAIAA